DRRRLRLDGREDAPAVPHEVVAHLALDAGPVERAVWPDDELQIVVDRNAHLLKLGPAPPREKKGASERQPRQPRSPPGELAAVSGDWHESSAPSQRPRLLDKMVEG